MNEFPPFEIVDGRYDNGLILLADHATNNLPPRYDRLGLPDSAFERHIAFDIGIEALTRALAARLDVPAVMSRYSRLLIDPNRGEDDPTIIMRISDGAIIPGNHPIATEEWQHRIETFHRPYHRAVEDTIERVATASGKAPLVLSLHSYTPAWKGVARPWHAAVLWDTDHRAIRPLIDLLSEPGDILVGDNEPYDGALKGDTMYRHCMTRGIPHALLEVRQDLIGHEDGVRAWVDRLAPIFGQMNADPALHRYQVHASRTGPYPTMSADPISETPHEECAS
uniref:N-formylglutamate amidohydrolase n=1 Tax=uncultured Rhizobium sp. TaxID=155567 RepID=UPI002617059D|nr:N-formylglutamate amidohydrolase [uncultured Rhizobium sp.]